MPSLTRISSIPHSVERILCVLPEVYRIAYLALSAEDKRNLSEIRLRANLPSSFTVSGLNIPIRASCGAVISNIFEIQEIIGRACDGSL